MPDLAFSAPTVPTGAPVRRRLALEAPASPHAGPGLSHVCPCARRARADDRHSQLRAWRSFQLAPAARRTVWPESGRGSAAPWVALAAGDGAGEGGLAGRVVEFVREGSRNGRFPLAAGVACLGMLAANRVLFTDWTTLVTSQSRSDEAALLSSLLLVFSGVLRINVIAQAPAPVALEGEEGTLVDASLSEEAQRELRWAAQAVLANTPARSVVVWCDPEGGEGEGVRGRCVLRAGVLGPSGDVAVGSLLGLAFKMQKELALPDLRPYPARTEFESFLPRGTQGVVVEPMGAQACLVAGTDTARVYTPQDRAWLAAVAAKLQVTLERELPALAPAESE
eukprot:tig00021759_g23426.t1